MHTASQVCLISAVTVRPKSLYEDVHASTGHPGYTGMQWHQKNTIGANYTDKDAASARGIFQGCALGSAHQYPTNQHYVKSDTPHDSGQQFVVDAFTHHSIGAGGFVYAHLFTDLDDIDIIPDIDTDPYLPEEPDKYNDNDIGNKFDRDGNIQYWYNLALNDRTKIKQGQIDQAEFSFRVLEKCHDIGITLTA